MEYEYSFEVKSLDKYIEYCKNNNYEEISTKKEIRTIYRNENKTMARITIEDDKDAFLDFKDDILNDEVLIERRETPKLYIDNMDTILSMLDFLNYTKDNTLDRKRTVYKKGNVTFELDLYKEPRETCVVAIEGEKNEVDKVYKEVTKIINECEE